MSLTVHLSKLACIYKNLYIAAMPGKDLFWVGSSLSDLRAFPEDARREAGHQLHLVQVGLQPDDWKPIPTVGSGVYEIRIHTAVEHRVFYVAKFAEGVFVLHAFAKKTQRTAKADIALGQQRLRDVLVERRERAARAKREK
jgi:phage-related protein